MRKRKRLIHAAFWSAYLLPDLFGMITHGIQDTPPEKFWVRALGVLSVAVTTFYALSEWLLPRCLRLKGWRRLYWLSLPALWIAASFAHMHIERWIQRSYGSSDMGTAQFSDYLIGMFWFMVIAAGIAFGYLWYENQLKMREAENLRVSAELAYLRYRVNPHFLFNTLNSLYALALDKSEKTPRVVLQLAQLMRYMLQDENQETTLQSEVKYLENYLELERMRLGDHVQINMHVEGDIDGQTIAPLLLLPFVENGFKHGVNDSLQDGYVEVALKVVDEELFFYAENSKRSKLIAQSQNKPSFGLGLANVRRRLDLIYGATRYNLEIEDTDDSYRVNLYLKLK